MDMDMFQYPLIGSGRCNVLTFVTVFMTVPVSVPSDRVRPLQPFQRCGCPVAGILCFSTL